MAMSGSASSILTTNLTSFFREPHHFPILPSTCANSEPGAPSGSGVRRLDRRRAVFDRHHGSRNLRQQCLACFIMASTSIPTCWHCVKGVYPIERVDKLSPSVCASFSCAVRAPRKACIRAPELKNMIQFQRINLLDQSYAVKGPLDVIFCRNVMIYFDKPTQYKILPASRR